MEECQAIMPLVEAKEDPQLTEEVMVFIQITITMEDIALMVPMVVRDMQIMIPQISIMSHQKTILVRNFYRLNKPTLIL